jgi:hypothetical protein
LSISWKKYGLPKTAKYRTISIRLNSRYHPAKQRNDRAENPAVHPHHRLPRSIPLSIRQNTCRFWRRRSGRNGLTPTRSWLPPMGRF